MSIIHQLSDAVCNKIAAGEVVERPASIVKELVENSLDAGATKIEVSLINGGRKQIIVRDNGVGMDHDDALLCLDAHATSKIRNEEDIFAISSFGFRGEAIPSIASVSKMRILTRQRDSAEGVDVFVNGGDPLSIKPAGCPPGTEITVSDLFFNLPARRAFLKTMSTEERHIIDILTNISLAHADVAFILKTDNRLVFSSSACTHILPRIRDFFGKEYADAMLPVSNTINGVSVSGFIARRDFTRRSRMEQRIFVNSRPVESPIVYRAIREACGPTLEKGVFQPAILYIQILPGAVDVNVHPTKREVRFKNEEDVLTAVRSAVSATLRLNDPVIPLSREGMTDPANVSQRLFADFNPADVVDLSTQKKNLNMESLPIGPASENSIESLFAMARVSYHVIGPNAFSQNPNITDDHDTAVQKGVGQAETQQFFTQENTDSSLPGINNELTASHSQDDMPEFRLVQDDATTADFSGNSIRVLGVLLNSYIIAEIHDGLVLIDQHAAHERVLFEKIINGINGTLSQELLLPIPLELTPADMIYVSRNKTAFEEIGFRIEPFGKNTIMLNAIPAALPQNNVAGFFFDLLARIGEIGAGQRLDTTLLARAACKAAIKAHDKISLQEAIALIEQMAHCALPYSCPHGRPTILNISLSEIERRFGRK